MLASRDRASRQKGALAALFVELFKGLRYTERIRQTIESPATRQARAPRLQPHQGRDRPASASSSAKRLLPRFPEESPVGAGLERLVFSIEMEVRKVMELELVDVVLMKDPKLIFTRMEDASGILARPLPAERHRRSPRRSRRRSTGGHSSRSTGRKLEQSLKLRDDLWELVQAVQAFSRTPDKKSLRALVDALDSFRRGSMRHLMFKDWSLFERFLAGFSRERTPRAFLPAAHQFEVFLKTLIREVGEAVGPLGSSRSGIRPTAARRGGGAAGASRYN